MKKHLPTVLILASPLAAIAQNFAVTGLLPARNAVGVAWATNVAVTLSQPLSGSSPTLNALRVYSSQRGGRVAGTTTVSGNTLTFDPMRNFKPGEVVRVTVTNRVLSTSSAALPTPQV